MTLFIFKFCLPALLGYTLFVGIAGRLNPFKSPGYPEERPSWLLALWTGLSITLVLGIGMHMAYSMPLDSAKSLAKPAAWFMAALLLPGFLLFWLYRKNSHSQLARVPTPNIDWDLQASQLDLIDSSDDDTKYWNDELISYQVDSLDTTMLDLATLDIHLPLENKEADANSVMNSRELEAEQQQITLNQQLQSTQHQLLEVNTLQEETEKHLRITRKALSALELESRDNESLQADTVIALEEQLANSIDQQSELDSQAFKEKAKRIELEASVSNLKQNLVKAKQDVRRGIAARAKALSTANKSIAFARQAVQIRARLETELGEAQDTLKNRQTTISSLIRALEKEKRRTEEDVTSMAKELVLHEKQLHAQRSLRGIARNVEKKLTSRLVKKVAKARPLMSNSQGK